MNSFIIGNRFDQVPENKPCVFSLLFTFLKQLLFSSMYSCIHFYQTTPPPSLLLVLLLTQNFSNYQSYIFQRRWQKLKYGAFKPIFGLHKTWAISIILIETGKPKFNIRPRIYIHENRKFYIFEPYLTWPVYTE